LKGKSNHLEDGEGDRDVVVEKGGRVEAEEVE
jgi:hypothetical protein